MHRDAELNELTGFGLGATLFLVQAGVLGLDWDGRMSEFLGHAPAPQPASGRAAQASASPDKRTRANRFWVAMADFLSAGL